MPDSWLVARRPGRRPLPALLEELLSARQEVGRCRGVPTDQQALVTAQRSLLCAMEAYAAALTERGLPTPWRLRDDLRLQRSIGTQHGASGRQR